MTLVGCALTTTADLDVGLADLSVVIAAHRHGTRRIVTFDERHSAHCGH